MHIEGERLYLRPLVAEDAAAVYAYTRRPDVMHYLAEGVFDRAAVAAFIAQPHTVAVVRKADEALLGHLVFEPYAGSHCHEIGWVFHPDHQGQGYATEAAVLALTYGFDHMGLHRVVAICQPEHLASRRVMEKLGMRREGCFHASLCEGDGRRDEYCYAILAQEWAEQRNKEQAR